MTGPAEVADTPLVHARRHRSAADRTEHLRACASADGPSMAARGYENEPLRGARSIVQVAKDGSIRTIDRADRPNRIRLANLPIAAYDAALLADRAWPERIMPRSGPLDRAGIAPSGVIDHGQRPIGACAQINIDEGAGADDTVGLRTGRPRHQCQCSEPEQ
jgi:hypothetical protein